MAKETESDGGPIRIRWWPAILIIVAGVGWFVAEQVLGWYVTHPARDLLVNDKLLIQAESGRVFLIATNPERFQPLGKLAGLADKTWNHPVVAGPYLLIRNDREAVCYQLNEVAERRANAHEYKRPDHVIMNLHLHPSF